MVITHRKDLCQGDYLIDDRGKNGTSEFAGEWIEFGSEKFPDWNSVLDYLVLSGKQDSANGRTGDARISLVKMETNCRNDHN